MSTSVRRLYESFQPSHYDLTLSIDTAGERVHGTVVIRGKKIGRPSGRLTFHQNGLQKIQCILVRQTDKKGNQTDVAIERVNAQDTLHEVRLHSSQQLYAGQYEVHLTFEVPVTRGMTGIYPCFFKVDGQEQRLLATQFESHHAREAFPCIDEPEAKATFDLTLIHNKDWTALSNMPVATQKPADQLEQTITTFQTTPRMSCYLLAFVLGNIHAKHGQTKRGTEVSVWGTAAQPADSFDFALESAIGSIEYFEDYFGVDYPLPKADHVALPDFSAGAMENWGLITYREAVLLLYPEAASQSTREYIALVVAHETSHQWFGNLVTMRWWDDLWLNESFANMMEYAAVDALHPDWHSWETFTTSEGLSALRRDSVYGVQAVRTAVHHPDEISTLFDPSIVYAKGGRLLYMLKNYIGDDAFRNGLKAYFTKHAYGNTEGGDLWAALSEASGQDVAAFMTPWLTRSGFPVVSIDQTGREVRLQQQHFLDNPAKADHDRLWPVPLFSDSAGLPVLLDKASRGAQLTDGASYAVLNQGARGHYVVRYLQPDHRAALTALIKDGSLSAPDRLMALNSNVMLAKAGYATMAETLTMLDAYKQEASEPVWDMIAIAIADARRFIDQDERLEAPLKALVRRIVGPQAERLGWQEAPNDSAADQKLRATMLGLQAYAEEPVTISEALRYFDEYVAGQTSLSAELRGIIFGVAVKQAHPGAFDYLLQLYADTANSDLQRDIAGALTSTHSPAEASRLLDMLPDSALVKPQDADHWLFYLLRNRYCKDVAWRWLVGHWDWIERTYKADKSYDYFPRHCAGMCNTRAWQDAYIEFFQPKTAETALKRNIMIGLEEIDSRLTWLERDLPSVQAFFEL